MVYHKLLVMGTSVIGRQEDQIVVLAHLLIEGTQQSCDILVEFKISLVGMFPTRSPLMTNHVSLRVTHTEHVRCLTFAQVLTLQGSNGHIGGDMSTKRV